MRWGMLVRIDRYWQCYKNVYRATVLGVLDTDGRVFRFSECLWDGYTRKNLMTGLRVGKFRTKSDGKVSRTLCICYRRVKWFLYPRLWPRNPSALASIVNIKTALSLRRFSLFFFFASVRYNQYQRWLNTETVQIVIIQNDCLDGSQNFEFYFPFTFINMYHINYLTLLNFLIIVCDHILILPWQMAYQTRGTLRGSNCFILF